MIGALFGLPMIAISIAIGGSDVAPTLVIVWLLLLFLAWGAGLRAVYIRLNPDAGLLELAEAEAPAVGAIDRRQFLVRLGAATATITVASSGLGILLAQGARRELEAGARRDDGAPVGGHWEVPLSERQCPGDAGARHAARVHPSQRTTTRCLFGQSRP